MEEETNIPSTTKKKWSKLPYYNENVGDGIFTSIQENLYRSQNVEVHIEEVDDDYWVLPASAICGDTNISYAAFIGIGEQKDIGGGLSFAIADIQRRHYENFQLELFEDGIILPMEYRWGRVALDIYLSAIDFAKKKWVNVINSDCDQSKWAVSIYTRLQWLGYQVFQNDTSIWHEKRFVSKDGNPNFIIQI